MARFAAISSVVLLCFTTVMAGDAGYDVAAAENLLPLRVRKEIRSLTDDEMSLYVKGLSTMLSVSTEEGQKLFGPAYKEYQHFIVQHAVATEDPRGDQAHGAPCFLSFHRAFVLEFENSLLSIVPELGAMPYWDFAKDCRGGEYSDPSDPNHIFSPHYAGSLTGDASQNYTVADGLFAYYTIKPYNKAKYGFQTVYNGSTHGLLRGSRNPNTHPYLVRYPYQNTPDSQAPWNKTILYSDPQPNELYIKYTEEQFNYCHDPEINPDWMSFQDCVDLTEDLSQMPKTSDKIVERLSKDSHAILHTMPHVFVAGASAPAPGAINGDFTDVSTSPNEVFLFMLHHANVDRSAMTWQTNSYAAIPDLANRDVLWKYPRTAADRVTWEGCYREDVISSNFPFTDIIPGESPANSQGYTHGELLWYTRPEATFYTYDTLVTYKEEEEEEEEQEEDGNGQEKPCHHHEETTTKKQHRKALM